MEGLKFNYKKLFSVKKAKRIIFVILSVFIYEFLFFHTVVRAESEIDNNLIIKQQIEEYLNAHQDDNVVFENEKNDNNQEIIVFNYKNMKKSLDIIFNGNKDTEKKDSEKENPKKVNKDNEKKNDNNKKVDEKDKDNDNQKKDDKNEKVTASGAHVITAYNSEASQTDASPCITANGYNLCKNPKEDTIAANFLPMGTKVRIPDLFGDRIFIVRDRMNRRHATRVDVWMLKKEDALKFGVKVAKIEIVK